MMREHFENIERELEAAINSATDFTALEYQLERLVARIEGAQFATRFAQFGKQLKASDASEREPKDEAQTEPSPFENGQKLRTKQGYLAYYGYPVGEKKHVVNVVFQAAEYTEADLKPYPI